MIDRGLFGPRLSPMSPDAPRNVGLRDRLVDLRSGNAIGVHVVDHDRNALRQSCSGNDDFVAPVESNQSELPPGLHPLAQL